MFENVLAENPELAKKADESYRALCEHQARQGCNNAQLKLALTKNIIRSFHKQVRILVILAHLYFIV
jgi:hypothetical protein